jgi:hypothetical protein
LTFIGIIAVVYAPLMVLETAVTALLGSPAVSGLDTSLLSITYVVGGLSVTLLALMQYVLVQGIATGALTRAVADNYLGKKTGILDAYRGIGRSWLSLITALFFVLLLFVVLWIGWVMIPCAGWFTGLGMMVFLMAAVNPLVAPVIVLEASGPWSSPKDNLLDRLGNWILRSVFAVRRAWNLARRRFWSVLGSIFILYLFSLLIVEGPRVIAGVLLGQLSDSFGGYATREMVTSIVKGLVSIVFVLIYYPLQMTAFTLIYFDLRVRTEGFDLALLTLEASGVKDVSDVTTVPVPAVNEQLITGAEIGNFAILTLAGIGITIFFLSLLMGSTLFFGSFLF